VAVLFLGGPATFVYTDWQRTRRSAARLHAAGLARTRAARDILQTRLQSMQARVEPRFLFDTLARVRNLYDRDPAQGERTLDALIAYLRTAMPRMRDAASTLGRECELARTYVDIVTARGDARLRIEVDLPEGSPQVVFPSMLLLPLVEVAAAHSRRTPLDDNSIEVRAQVDGGRLRVSVAASNAAFVDADLSGSEVVGSVRERLQTLFDADARIELRAREGGGSQATMELPHEQR
jgi:LytS/YehU family sensor histidine kinase